MWDFEHGSASDVFDISYTVPSQCALELQNGNADIGIIPSAAYAGIPDLAILPGVAIASKQAVRSILLVSRKPLDQIRSVALDGSSLTSVALTRILFQQYWRLDSSFNSVPPDLGNMLAVNDAALLIGDPALKVDREKYNTWDLAEEWIQFTGKPFVFAFWAVTRSSTKSTTLDLAAIFQESRNHGLEASNMAVIARSWAPKLGLSEPAIKHYLEHNIYYYLDEACLEGLRLFYRLAAECDLIPRVPDLQFADAKALI